MRERVIFLCFIMLFPFPLKPFSYYGLEFPSDFLLCGMWALLYVAS